jgi:predicted Zn finger-like uncharacterized protein
MPTTTCPECQRDLRVPDSLIGAQVRCPHCQTQFLANDGSAPAPISAEEGDAVKPPPIESPSGNNEPRESQLNDASSAFRAADTESPAAGESGPPSILPPRPDLDDDGEDDDDLEEGFESARQKRRETESYENAKRRLMAPAICLIVIGTIGLVIDGFRIVVLIVQLATAGAAAMAGPFGDKMIMAAVAVMSLTASILWGALVLYGGVQMLRMRRFGMALTGCIIAMLPCFDGCCIFGLPIAIWGLVVMFDETVRRHFQN